MGFLGRYQLGEEVPLAVHTTDANDLPIAPAAAPAVSIYRGTLLVASFALPAQDPGGQTGFFACRLFLGSAYGAGPYQVVYRYLFGSTPNAEWDAFDVLAGGDSNGAIIGLAEYNRPHANFLLYQTDGGLLTWGRNPRT